MASSDDKGLTYAKVAAERPFRFGRPKPGLPFASARRPGWPGSVQKQTIPVELVEEANVARKAAPVTFGLPLPKGALFDPQHMRVLSPAGDELLAQFTPIAFWPDDSLKWVLVDFTIPIAAGARAICVVAFGCEVTREVLISPLTVEETPDAVIVDTGAIQVTINKRRFNIFAHVSRAGEPLAESTEEGVRLITENGGLFALSSMEPDSIAIEECGPQKVVVRAAGSYANESGERCMSYVTRLSFRAGSPRVAVAHSHIDDYLQTEFADIVSLSMPIRLLGGARRAATCWTDSRMHRRKVSCELTASGGLSIMQWDDVSFLLRSCERKLPGHQHPGFVAIHGERSDMAVVAHEFWQRYPKGIRADEQGVTIDLLPEQTSSHYGDGIPYYLTFPFVAGKYRFKWGMAFTQRITFDFGDSSSNEDLCSEANTPLVAVLPAAWYASTGALGPIVVPGEGAGAEWDAFVAHAYDEHTRRREENREYGYLNYGDWYGERGVNWGNNEYDLAHGFFMEFVRTGRRDYFRLALAAARHQADVDTIHAYPDARFVGSSISHGIGHTGGLGPWSMSWSEPYSDWKCTGNNGHIWTDGLMDAWCLSGEARVMEACLSLGEHLVWATAPRFDSMEAHERGAGWALAALTALNRGTYDHLYLEAAKQIASVPLRDQSFHEGGAWPHVLPPGHADQCHQGARGNCVFLIGVLLSGLKDLHEETQDPRLAECIVAAARWILSSWDEEAATWPYSASPRGEPTHHWKPTRLNSMIMEAIAYAGILTGEPRFFEVAKSAFRALLRMGPPSLGNNLGSRLHFAASTMGILEHWRGMPNLSGRNETSSGHCRVD